MQMRILVVEDDVRLGGALQGRIEHAGFVVDVVASCAEAYAAAASVDFALIVLDRRLPDGDGLDQVKTFRLLRPGIRIIILTALDKTDDKIKGLDAGADDYLTKPFHADELLARIRAALRRPGAALQPPVRCGNVAYFPDSRDFTVHDTSVRLKRREHLILEALMLRARRVVQREALMEAIYGFEDEVQSNALDAQISRLRARLAEVGASVQIRPVRGVGYMLSELHAA
jgi:DNA-binding response OmpR family regulator